MNYRDIIKRNRRKTKIVLGIYLMIYTFIGLMLDMVISNQHNISFLEALNNLVTFKIFPIGTFILFGIGIITILISIKIFTRILLDGEENIEVDENNREYRDLYNIIEELKISAGMKYIPKIYVIKADYLNAFASGWNEDNTLVAVTEGLINKLTRAELSAVMAHEMTHIRNEDVKLTLLIGVTTNVMLFVVNYITFLIGGNSRNAQIAKTILIVFQFILPIITILLQMYLSRSREYMADSGAVELTRDNQAMANALRKISGYYDEHEVEDNNKSRKSAYIFVKGDSLFSTHPNIKNRIDKCLGY